ncbi:hypothetical protein SAMN04488134_103119 [Amphibacillus marinus]|uniref:Uncharacterized protein n=1 Tax=Amphibacillus marinus TaxID=872970 RepID=A0A1H8L846_9BACI|nr:hypothetical protein [Amphibacillus marinus]SEO01354.1 hypothetical protein SAMN04488134_103119 [Amphibacillus marinus]
MRKVRLIFNCLVASVLTTLTILVISFIVLLFSNEHVGYYTTYFGAVTLEISEDSPEWDLYMQFGLDINQLHPIWITILLISIFYYVISVSYISIKHKPKLTL